MFFVYFEQVVFYKASFCALEDSLNKRNLSLKFVLESAQKLLGKSMKHFRLIEIIRLSKIKLYAITDNFLQKSRAYFSIANISSMKVIKN